MIGIGSSKNLFNSTFFGLPENVYRHESSEFGDGDQLMLRMWDFIMINNQILSLESQNYNSSHSLQSLQSIFKTISALHQALISVWLC